MSSAGINPAEHYLKYGWLEGRDPSPDFNNNDYLNKNPNVLFAGINPLLHYINNQKGKSRGFDSLT